jgi:hypothetical protein
MQYSGQLFYFWLAAGATQAKIKQPPQVRFRYLQLPYYKISVEYFC